MARAKLFGRKRKRASTASDGTTTSVTQLNDQHEQVANQDREASDEVLRTSRPNNGAASITEYNQQQTPASQRLPAEVLTNILSRVLVRRRQPVYLRSSHERRWGKEIEDLRGPLPRLRFDRRWSYKLGMRENPGARGRTQNPSWLLRVLRVNKAFYFAGIDAFYGGNELGFPGFPRLRAFLDDTDKDRKSCIKRLHLIIHFDFKYVDREAFLNIHKEKPDNITVHDLAPYCRASDLAFLSADLSGELSALETVTVVADTTGIFSIDPARERWLCSNIEALVRRVWSRQVNCDVSLYWEP